ncbi:NAD(P)-dependent dehydrogenase (short-subunit alcohol dehydrogenase family) [Sphingomonas jejuensis]|uniref:NAD(P)-dependent dehydrogenase (Short-subunit alcohol dehydrogenase family) n=1 Tax=Sphingomonas jejuensis TaxID=904715 RepID=A0ABX0XJG9_9SPHN|nr:glucose 1-dehydrogenase [Sphingomonas jejuensis]NJC32886.1 NAD(P)-dependent dehydrogenase (short-subunit alcohol dehydrogenase family) [Sphingomonas jejuensis]
MTRLSGKVTIVTGGASGLGEATARRFAKEGAIVILSDINDAAGERIAAEIGAHFRHADVTREADVAALVDEAVARHGRLDVMISNAGLAGAVGSITELSEDGWRKTCAVLLDSVFFGTKHAARVMRAQRSGVILSTTSVAGVAPLGPHAYTAAKHGVVGLTRSVAAEMAPHGVRVNAVAPGTVPTFLTAQVYGGADAVREAGAARNPLGRSVEADEIAAAFAYLASDDGRSITGQVLVVDAGLSNAMTPPGYHDRSASYIGAETAG